MSNPWKDQMLGRKKPASADNGSAAPAPAPGASKKASASGEHGPASLAFNLTAHAWNHDMSMVAVSPNTHEVMIYDTNKGSEDVKTWSLLHTLEGHSEFVSGIDWSPVTNLIVTSGHDRNAYVWKYDEKVKEWKPTLVILRINRAATAVKWSPMGNKFAVTSGAKKVPICHFEESNDWWISKPVTKKHKSTILAVDWCANNKFIVTGAADFKCRLISAWIEGIDADEDDGFGEVWPKQHEFGEILAEFDQAKAWVNGVAWSPFGFRVAFSGHGSTMHFVQILADRTIVKTVYHKGLPFVDVAFLDDNTVLAVGWDRNPTTFTVTGGSDEDPEWAMCEQLDKPKKEEKKVVGNAFANKFNKFQAAADHGAQFGDAASDVSHVALNTLHQNTIYNLRLLPPADENSMVTRFTTSGLDGRLLFWDLRKLDGINKAAYKL